LGGRRVEIGRLRKASSLSERSDQAGHTVPDLLRLGARRSSRSEHPRAEGEVRHTFAHVRNQQFPKKKEFKAWLKQSGQTVADLLFRVRLNLASTRIQKHVLAGHHGAHSQQRALKRFVHDFKLKWEAQTYCDPAYTVTDCGHVQASL
jgi:hypothetical protein